MKNLIKKWLGIEDRFEPAKDAPYFLINRYYLSSIKPEDADEYLSDLTEQEKKEYESEASTVYNNPVFKKEIKHLLGLQSLYVSSQVENWERSLVGRGTINGIGLVLDRFETLHSRHLENVKLPEDVNRFDLLP